MLTLLNYFSVFANYQVSISMQVYFWSLYSGPLAYISILYANSIVLYLL